MHVYFNILIIRFFVFIIYFITEIFRLCADNAA